MSISQSARGNDCLDAARQSPTIDEPVHLSSGISYWTTGEFDLNRGNPPFVDMISTIPVLALNPNVDWKRWPNSFLVAGDFYNVNKTRSVWLTIVGRWALLPFAILSGYVCWLWAARLFGHVSGVLALGIWCFCPFVIANAEIVTGDMASTSLILTTCYLFWRWMNSPTWGRVLATGIFWGLAELAKFVSVVLYPLIPCLWIAGRLCKRNAEAKTSWRQESLQIGAMLLLSIYMINWGYLFDGTGQPLGSFKTGQDLLTLLSLESQTEVGIFARIPVLLPEDYVRGIDEIRSTSQFRPRMYFAGVWSNGGWWHYYLSGLSLKLPLGTLFLIELAVFVSLISSKYRVSCIDEAMLLVPFAAFLTFVSIATSIQYLRYVLPALPFLAIWASKVGMAWRYQDRIVGAPIVVAGFCTILATFSVFPHSGSYFNHLAGGPENGHAFMLESSIDWGQDALYLEKWLDENPDARPFHLAYFGHFDPRFAGVEFQLTPTKAELEFNGLDSLKTGWHAVSVSLLRGFGWPVVPDGNGGSVNITPSDYQYFLSIEPTTRIGYSINVYHLDEADIEIIGKRLGISPVRVCRD